MFVPTLWMQMFFILLFCTDSSLQLKRLPSLVSFERFKRLSSRSIANVRACIYCCWSWRGVNCLCSSRFVVSAGLHFSSARFKLLNRLMQRSKFYLILALLSSFLSAPSCIAVTPVPFRDKAQPAIVPHSARGGSPMIFTKTLLVLSYQLKRNKRHFCSNEI